MKRQQIIMIVCGIVTAAVCGVAGWFLFTQTAAKNRAAEERDQAYQELQKIYRGKVFPSDENIARVGEDQKVLEGWLVTASNQLHKGDLQIEPKTPTSFKQALQATVRKLSAQPGAVQGKVVAPGFNFGFDQYLGQSDSLPATEHVNRLTAQLTIIEKLCEGFMQPDIMELKSVSREVFDVVKRGGGRRPPRVGVDAAGMTVAVVPRRPDPPQARSRRIGPASALRLILSRVPPRSSGR